jgi:hypothetical protein
MEGKYGAGGADGESARRARMSLIILFIQMVLDNGKVVRSDFHLLGNKILNIFINKLLFPD